MPVNTREQVDDIAYDEKITSTLLLKHVYSNTYKTKRILGM